VSGQEPSPRQRLKNWALPLLATGLVLAPAFGPLSNDSFPLSTYPMFAATRGRPRMGQILGVDAQGTTHRLSPELLGSSEVLQAKALVERAINGGAKQRDAFCAAVAARVRKQGNPLTLKRLDLAKVRFDPIEYFTVGPTPIERDVVASCSVGPAQDGQ
jgi:hypothetical protein